MCVCVSVLTRERDAATNDPFLFPFHELMMTDGRQQAKRLWT